MSRPPFFDETSEAVRFWVPIDDRLVGASISRQTLHYHYCARSSGEDHLETYQRNADEIAAAVRRRIAAGSLEPVIVRESDLRGAGG